METEKTAELLKAAGWRAWVPVLTALWTHTELSPRRWLTAAEAYAMQAQKKAKE